MPTDDRIKKKLGFRTPMLLLGFAMMAFYLVIGIWLLVDKTFLAGIPDDFRNIFAIMLLVYGAYRSWRVYADYF